LDDGEIGIMPGRAPLIGRLGYGELRIKTGGKVSRYYVDGGFVQVADNVVSVLTNRAVPADRVNSATATEQLEAAFQRRATTAEEEQIRDRLIAQSRAQIRLAGRK
jgi:F-type H+-transporting ATPase subunit epsilon